MKKFICAMLFIVASVCVTPAAFAAEGDLVIDEAMLLTESQAEELNERAKEISEQYQCDVAIITMHSMTGGDAFAYAEQVYRQYGIGYGEDESGQLMFLSMVNSDYALVAYGYGHTAFTDHGKDVILDDYVLPLLSSENYYSAFSVYLDKSAEYLNMARNGTPFDVNTDTNYTRADDNLVIKLGIMILLPLLIAFIICMVWRSKMKTARAERAANRYIPEDGFALTGQSDTFLYVTETRRKIESNSSSRGGGTTKRSSGFSGRSGKF